MHRSDRATVYYQMRVLITGAAGSGTTTLAGALARHWAVPSIEADEFFWLPTKPPYTSRRDPAERRALFEQKLLASQHCVVAGSIVGWGVESLLGAVVFLYVDAGVRVQRLRAREEARFGEAHPEFLQWASQYDEGPPEGRSLAKHETWLRALTCPVIRLVGELSVAEQISRIADLLPNPSIGHRPECPESLKAILAALEISIEAITARSLVLHPEAAELVVADTDEGGKEHLLVPPAADAWRAMKASALADGIVVRIVSAFRTIDRQAEIVRAKLEKGLSLEEILCVSAPPGFSEHHSGRAIDLTTDGVRPLEEEFEQTSAFRWLTANAGRFGCVLSFPRNNPYGYAYEPWHWYFGGLEA